MYCIHCGHELPNDAKFCVNCGQPTGVVLKEEEGTRLPEEEPTVGVFDYDDGKGSEPDFDFESLLKKTGSGHEEKKTGTGTQPQPASKPTAAATPIPQPTSKPQPTPAAKPDPAPASAPQAPYANGTNGIVPKGGTIRFRCPNCGEVSDIQVLRPCAKCHTAPAPGGFLKLYRMGNAFGVAAKFSLYFETNPTGFIGNKQTLYIYLPYGEHSLHIACNMNRRCKDLTFTLSPEQPLVGAHVYIKMGVWSNTQVIEEVDPATLPD